MKEIIEVIQKIKRNDFETLKLIKEKFSEKNELLNDLINKIEIRLNWDNINIQTSFFNEDSKTELTDVQLKNIIGGFYNKYYKEFELVPRREKRQFDIIYKGKQLSNNDLKSMIKDFSAEQKLSLNLSEKNLKTLVNYLWGKLYHKVY